MTFLAVTLYIFVGGYLGALAFVGAIFFTLCTLLFVKAERDYLDSDAIENAMQDGNV